MVIGDRLSSTYFTENKRPFHNCGNMLVRRCINMFWKRGRQIEDVMTGMRAMSPLFVKSFPILSQGFEIETEMTIFPWPTTSASPPCPSGTATGRKGVFPS